MSKIQFEDKVQTQERPEFSDNQKVNASDMNEIKNVVNGNDENAVYKNEVKTINGQSILGEGNLIVTGEGGDTLPIGSMLPYGNVNPPANWLVCDGSAVSRTTYADLFSVIGTTYGEGDGSTTFNLPNKKGRVSAGYDATNSQFNSIGKHIGEEKHTQTVDELANHGHGFTNNVGNIVANQFSQTGGITNYQSGAGLGTTGIAQTGGGQPFNIIQPTEVDQWIIKAFQSAGVIANVAQAKTTSDTDTYACTYINSIDDKIDNSINYSTDEVAIGKWIDGRTIYKKTVVPQVPSQQHVDFGLLNGVNNLIIFPIEIMVVKSNGTSIMDFSWFDKSSINMHISYDPSANLWLLSFDANIDDLVGTYYITITYIR